MNKHQRFIINLVIFKLKNFENELNQEQRELLSKGLIKSLNENMVWDDIVEFDKECYHLMLSD